jgi:acylphosphatase
MTVHLFISGRVQGIGFRQFVKHHANKLNLKGWVTNLSDGRVEALLDGEEKKVREMVEICRKGPFLAEVKNVDIDWNYELPADIIDFQIIK